MEEVRQQPWHVQPDLRLTWEGGGVDNAGTEVQFRNTEAFEVRFSLVCSPGNAGDTFSLWHSDLDSLASP